MRIISRYILGIVLLAFFAQSCSTMNDSGDQFLDEGEIIYAAKVDSVISRPGNERIQLDLSVASQRIETIRIFWNDYADSSDVHIGNQIGTFPVLLNDMEEKGYVFQLISIDKDGNRSLPVEVTGTVYGNNYQTSLSNRMIKSITALLDGTLTISWSGIVDNGLYCNLSYVNTSGDQIDKIILMSETTTVLTDLASDIEYNTAFLPDSAAIDTFYTDFVVKKVYADIDKSDWTATADSYEATGQLPNGAPEKTIDGDVATYWHTQHVGGMPGFPHWLAYDMKKKIDVAVVELTSRSDYFDADFTDFIVQQSADGVIWSDCGAFNLANTAGAQSFVLQNPVTTRYIRIYMTAGPNSYTHLAEFSVGTYID